MNLSLNGEWRLVADSEDGGIKEGWFSGAEPGDAIMVTVPGGADIPSGWYFRDFEVGPAWLDRYVEFVFEGVVYTAEVWLNGVRLGGHTGGYTPFTVAAGDAIRGGANRLAVRVSGREGPGTIWGNVEVRARSFHHIQDVFIEPDIRRKQIQAVIETSSPGEVRLSIEGTPFAVAGEPGRLRLEFPEHELWSPESPVLYMLRCELIRAGRLEDTRQVRFGMREIGAKDNHFYLNNHPIFVKGVVHEPGYPAGCDLESVLRRELEAAKQAGFNLVRFRGRPALQRSLEIADELGLMVYEESAACGAPGRPPNAEQAARGVRELIRRDRNHACVVIWGVCGGPEVCDESARAELSRLARSLDPSRLVIDVSAGMSPSRRPSRMIRPYRNDLEPYDDLQIYQRAPVDRDIELYYTHNGDPNRLVFLSEFGFGGPAVLPEERLDAAQKGFAERALDRVFGDLSGLLAEARKVQADAIRFQVDACRSSSKLSGYCYAQLTDSPMRFSSGILDQARQVKPAVQAMAEVQKPMRPLIHITQTNLTPREEAPVLVTLANNHRLEGRADLSLQVIGPTNQVLWKKKRTIKIPRHGKELWTGTVGASGSPGTHKFVVRLVQGMTCMAENSVELHVVEPAEPCNVEVNLLDPQRQWTERCIRFAKAGSVFAMVHIVPPLANTVRAYPDNELAQILAQIQGGAVGIVFSPPGDWNDLAERIEPTLTATSADAVGAPMGAYHYVKLHPVFDGLPARGFMRQPYRNVVPAKTFLESSDEDICGTFSLARTDTCWGSDILVRRYGSGRLVFTHLRILEHVGHDPVADRLFVNLLKHFSRRSVPPESILPLDQKAVEWLRRERTERVRRWMVVGMFPNWGGKGHETVYPPEQEFRPDAVYPGWYKAIAWTPWYSRTEDAHVVDLQEAFAPVYGPPAPHDYGTGYAYGEFSSDKRQAVGVRLGTQNPAKVWLNGRLVLETNEYAGLGEMRQYTENVMFRQGRNTLLVKVSKTPGPFRFGVTFEGGVGEPAPVKWWK